jgi:hypothetical protein
MRSLLGVIAMGATLVAGLSDRAYAAVVFDFTGGTIFGANLGKTQSFIGSGGATVTATAINTQEPPNPRLHQSAYGLGVNLGLGDVNQIDNIGDDEAIVFGFSAPITFVSADVTLTLHDSYAFYGTNDASVLGCTTTGLNCLTGVSTLLTSGTASGLLAPLSIALGGTYRYLIATVPGRSGDGFRISGLTVVPLPAALPLAASALGLLAWLSRRRGRPAAV